MMIDTINSNRFRIEDCYGPLMRGLSWYGLLSFLVRGLLFIGHMLATSGSNRTVPTAICVLKLVYLIRQNQNENFPIFTFI